MLAQPAGLVRFAVGGPAAAAVPGAGRHLADPERVKGAAGRGGGVVLHRRAAEPLAAAVRAAQAMRAGGPLTARHRAHLRAGWPGQRLGPAQLWMIGGWRQDLTGGVPSAFGGELRVDQAGQPCGRLIDEPDITEHVCHHRAGRRRRRRFAECRRRAGHRPAPFVLAGAVLAGAVLAGAVLAGAGHRVHRGPQSARVGVHIHLRRGHRGVSEQVSDHIDPGAGISEIAAAGMPQLMRANRGVQPGPQRRRG